MLRLTVIVGGLLVVLGVGAYVLSGAVSVTALIPAFVGVVLLLCAALARRPNLRRAGLVTAWLVALVATLGLVRNVLQLGDLLAGTAARPAAVLTSLIMFVLLVGYLVAGAVARNRTRRAETPS